MPQEIQASNSFHQIVLEQVSSKSAPAAQLLSGFCLSVKPRVKQTILLSFVYFRECENIYSIFQGILNERYNISKQNFGPFLGCIYMQVISLCHFECVTDIDCDTWSNR